MRDEISTWLIQCPECREWACTEPGEAIPNQFFRVCDLCEAEFIIDIATVPILGVDNA